MGIIPFLQFLETFVNKNIRLNNISEWRRTICGDLVSAFSPFNGEPLQKRPFLDRDKNVETIFNAKFKEEPNGFKKLSDQEIAQISAQPSILSAQEKGTRPACALPYELYTDGGLSADGKSFEIKLAAANEVFGKNASGSPFTVYAPVKFSDEGKTEVSRNWSFAVAAGDHLAYNWPLSAFENNRYYLRVHGPNGFYREFSGNSNNPQLKISCNYEKNKLTGKLTGNVLVKIINNDVKAHNLQLSDNAYKGGNVNKAIAAKSQATVVLDLSKNYHWYDFSVKVKGADDFEERFAGRVETGAATKTDPVMGGVA